MAGDRHFYVESFDTVRLNAFRVEQSPFAHRYATDRTVFGIYCDRLFPLKTTPDETPLDNYWKLRRGVMLYDVPEKPLEIAGPDASRVLERVLTCRVKTLEVGRCRYGVACREDGTVLMDGVVMRLGPERYWYVKADGEFEAWLAAHAVGLDAEVSDPGSRVLQIQGPKSLDVLDAAVGGGLSPEFKYFRAGFFDVCGQRLWVSRTGWTGEAGIEVYCNSGPEPTDHDALWDGLLACGAPYGMEFSSSSSMGIRRVEAGILDNGSDIEAGLTPYGAGLGQFVKLDKGDFIGRAALESADRSQLLFGLVCACRHPVGRHEQSTSTAVRSGTSPWEPGRPPSTPESATCASTSPCPATTGSPRRSRLHNHDGASPRSDRGPAALHRQGQAAPSGRLGRLEQLTAGVAPGSLRRVAPGDGRCW